MLPVDLPGFCACQDGYSGDACEIELATPPMLLRVGAEGSNGICDLELNSLQACRTTVLRGNRFLPGSICRITTLNVSLARILIHPFFCMKPALNHVHSADQFHFSKTLISGNRLF